MQRLTVTKGHVDKHEEGYAKVDLSSRHSNRKTKQQTMSPLATISFTMTPEMSSVLHVLAIFHGCWRRDKFEPSYGCFHWRTRLTTAKPDFSHAKRVKELALAALIKHVMPLDEEPRMRKMRNRKWGSERLNGSLWKQLRNTAPGCGSDIEFCDHNRMTFDDLPTRQNLPAWSQHIPPLLLFTTHIIG